MSRKLSTVYVQLLGEGTTVYRPVEASVVGQGLFLLQCTKDYDPEDERWEFLPGAVVQCRSDVKDGKEVLIACREGGR